MRISLFAVAVVAAPAIAVAQADTTRRPDTTRAAQQDSSRRVRSEARGEIDLAREPSRFGPDRPNFGLTSEQAAELQQALTRAGCDVGTADGVVGQRTLRGLECLRAQRKAAPADLESLFTALGVSFARQPVAVPDPEPPRRDTTVLPPVLRPDTTYYRADVRARRDSALKRDSTLRRDSLGRDSTTRRDSTARRDTTKRPSP